MKVIVSIIALAVGLTAQAQENVIPGVRRLPALNGPVDGPACKKVGDNLALTPCVLASFGQTVLGSAITKIDSTPLGADIVYDGVVLSRTPAMLILHNQGSLESTAITLRKAGYKDAQVKIYDGGGWESAVLSEHDKKWGSNRHIDHSSSSSSQSTPIPLELDSSTKSPESKSEQETPSDFPQKLEQAYQAHQDQVIKTKPSAPESQADKALDAALGDCQDSMIGTGRFFSVDLAGNLDLRRSSLRVMVACQTQLSAWITSCEKETGLIEGNSSSCTAMSLRTTASLVHDAWNHRANLKAWANRP